MKVREEMEQVAVRILEEWALMLVEPATECLTIFDSDDDLLVAGLKFRGIVNGRYEVICQSAFARALSANLLGLDDDNRPEDMLDALKEMVNVVSGNLLTSSYGEDTSFALTSPEVRVVPKSELKAVLGSCTLCYRADDVPVLVSFVPEEISDAD